jgi:hypothetical protein
MIIMNEHELRDFWNMIHFIESKGLLNEFKVYKKQSKE